MAPIDSLLSNSHGRWMGLPARTLRNQGNYDTCFSCAIAACLEGRDLGVPELSEVFHVYQSFSSPQVERGLEPLEAMSSLGRYGICAKKDLYDHPIEYGKPADPPGASAFANAAYRRSGYSEESYLFQFRRLSDLYRPRLWQTQILSRLPVLILIYQNQGYLDMQNWPDPDRRAIWSDGETTGPTHAAVILGFDAVEEMFVVQDSQGESFGNEGQWYLPFSQASSMAIREAYQIDIPIHRLL